MKVVPGVFSPQKIEQDFTCALPNFSIIFAGLKNSEPWISSGRKPFLVFIFTPKSFKNSNLEKSLLDKLLSPTSLIFFYTEEHRPRMHLASVPELPASIVISFFI